MIFQRWKAMNPSLPQNKQKVFHIIMIKPTRYGPDGYPLQWYRTFIPSNTLSCIYALAEDCKTRQILGKDVDIVLHPIDETNRRINHKALIKTLDNDGAKGLVMMVGVQTNQFPRAVDLSRPFLNARIPVCIGGFHVSGCLSMFGKLTPELRAAGEMGISFFAGEAEERRLDELIQDAFEGSLKPLYDHLKDLPGIAGQPPPFLPSEHMSQFFNLYATMDLGRGCPYGCSFCTVINVQGRKSRTRTVDDLEAVVRRYQSKTCIPFEDAPLLRWFFRTKAIKRDTQCYFLTDDNFSRNSNWEALLDRLIELREKEGIKTRLQIQVDADCHRIPGFIEKCVQAGVDQVFVGIENINPANLAGVKKTQNKIEEYRDSILAWKKHPVVVYAAYIIGFPQDSRESVLADIEILKSELAIDLVHFTILTPLPGSEDHREMIEKGIWMDPDLNKYALCNKVTRHTHLTTKEWEAIYREAYDRFYTDEHIETILKRMIALGSNKKITTINAILIYAHAYSTYGIHPLEAGFLRRKFRLDRQPGKTIENPVTFYPRYAWECFVITARTYRLLNKLRKKLNVLWTDQKRFAYTDVAIRMR